MSHPIVTNTTTPNLPIPNRILDRPPALPPGLRPTVRTMQQEQVDIPQPAHFHTLRDGPAHGIVVVAVGRQFRRVKDVLARERTTTRLGQPRRDGFTRLALVVVHLRAVEAAVPHLQGVRYRGEDFPPGHHVQSQLELWHHVAAVELGVRRVGARRC